jgi:hypothetical protein
MDLDDLPDDVRGELTFVPVEQIDQVLQAALVPPATEPIILEGKVVPTDLVETLPAASPGNGHKRS